MRSLTELLHTGVPGVLGINETPKEAKSRLEYLTGGKLKYTPHQGEREQRRRRRQLARRGVQPFAMNEAMKG